MRAPWAPDAQLTRARAILSTDLLSPLLGASLFPDALQRILPLPIRSFDRARALEYALEDGWRRASTGCKGCNPERMAQPVAGLYAGASPRKPVPHLFLNTTEAGTGLSRPFATWEIGDLAVPERSVTEAERQALPHSTLVPVQNLMRRDDVPLSTASMLSARFPYLTPAAKLGSTGHYVDGGYFENSGTWLLSGIAQNLIGQRLDYIDPNGDKALERAVQNTIVVVVVIRSEPCTRRRESDGCDEEIYKGDADSTLERDPLAAARAARHARQALGIFGQRPGRGDGADPAADRRRHGDDAGRRLGRRGRHAVQRDPVLGDDPPPTTRPARRFRSPGCCRAAHGARWTMRCSASWTRTSPARRTTSTAATASRAPTARCCACCRKGPESPPARSRRRRERHVPEKLIGPGLQVSTASFCCLWPSSNVASRS